MALALVTGTSSGIGLATAVALARAGHTVAGTMRNLDGGAEIRKIAAAGKLPIHLVALDVDDDTSVRDGFAKVVAEHGPIDVLVNNAGIMKLAKVADCDDAAFDQQIAINLKGSFNGMREAARRLRDGGRIINFSTSVVGTKLETYSVYTATKAAVETMTAILSKELRGRHITVNAVAPGPVSTELFLAGKSPELVERMAKMPPLERLGTPEDIAAVVSFLAGPDGGWINGQVLRANGGLV